MSLREVALSGWTGDTKAVDQTAALESGNVLVCRQLPFDVANAEARLFTPAILGGAKNAAFDPVSGRLGGTSLTGTAGDEAAGALAGMMRRFSDAAAGLVDALCPPYRGGIV